MKTKRVEKKLALNKLTIADLNQYEMKSIVGGIDTCGSCRSDCFCSTIITEPRVSDPVTC